MELRVDPTITSASNTATITDIYDLHNAGPEPDATGKGVTVAVMDTGIDDTHPVFSDVSVEHHDFTGSGTGDAIGHGTAVGGLVAMLAPGVELVSLRVFGDSGRTGLGPITDAYQWLLDNAGRVDVCNFSWGAKTTVDQINRIHRKVIEAGIRDVVAAGNTGGRGGSPATTRGAFSAGAVTEDGKLTRFSSYNPDRDNPDVAAVGKDVKLPRAEGTSMGQVIDEKWVKASGTSFSAPITAGFTARYLSTNDGGSMQRFEQTARDIPKTPEDGEGILDYGKAMSGGGGDGGSSKPTTKARVWEVFGSQFVSLDDTWFTPGAYTAVREDDSTVRLQSNSGDGS